MGVAMLTMAWGGAAAGPLPVDRPGAALADLLAAHGAALAPGSDDPRALDAMPAPVAAGLAGALRAFAAFEAATFAAYDAADLGLIRGWAHGTLPAPASAAQAWALAGFDPAGIVAARAQLLAATVALQQAVSAAGPLPPVRIAAPAVVVIDMGVADNLYPEYLALLVDAGGLDTYTNNAGGSNLLGECIAQFGPGAGALLDFAGDDRYVGPTRGCGVNGGASIGAGFLYDAAGNDVYATDFRVGNKAVNGGGAWTGVGFLLDAEGNDVYEAGGWGTNGGGYVGGTGALVDRGGDDRYAATYDGVNGGAFLGVGLLLDEAGHDLYQERCTFSCTSAWDETIVPKGAAGAQLDL